MKDRPILFSPPMVRAILEGRKTQTRRVVTPEPIYDPRYFGGLDKLNQSQIGGFVYKTKKATTAIASFNLGAYGEICSYGQPGDRLWVREAYWAWGKWAPNGFTKTGRKKWKFVPVGTSLRYQENKPSKNAKRDGKCGWVYRHARYMPKAHSRLTIEITDVRVQRLQEISEGEAEAEGIAFRVGPNPYRYSHITGDPTPGHPIEYFELASEAFRKLWDSINGKTHPWTSKPWVWAISFKRIDFRNKAEEVNG